MPNAAGDRAAPTPHDPKAAYRALVSDLVSLVAQVQNSLRRIERAMDEEVAASGPDSSDNVIVLDDVSPRYVKAVAALRACDADLGAVLNSLLESGERERCAASRTALSAIGA
jgi:hypothetical protein